MFEWNDGTCLYHHGIPGMKWGVTNGPPYPLGIRQRSAKEKRHEYQDKNYEKKITLKDAWSNIPEEQRTAIKRIAIGAAIGLGVGVGAYVILKNKTGYQTHDLVIPSGEVLARVSPASEKDLHDVFYAAYGNHDIQRYAATLPKHYNDRGANEVIQRLFHHNGDIKIAGHDTCEKVFKKISSGNGAIFDDYDAFNRKVVARNTERYKELYSRFFTELKKMGYDGFLDINDQKYSGYMAKAPLILFNDNMYSVDRVTKLAHNGEKFMKEYRKLSIEEQLQDLAKPTLITNAMLAGGLGGVSIAYNTQNSRQKMAIDKIKRGGK